MRIITVEEHYISNEVNRGFLEDGSKEMTQEQKVKAKFISDYIQKDGKITDLGRRRIEFMDRAGIDIQFLSYGNNSPMSLSGKDAIRLSREANDELFHACKENPDRLYGLATLPAGEPEAAAEEMERTAKELQFRGAL